MEGGWRWRTHVAYPNTMLAVTFRGPGWGMTSSFRFLERHDPIRSEGWGARCPRMPVPFLFLNHLPSLYTSDVSLKQEKVKGEDGRPTSPFRSGVGYRLRHMSSRKTLRPV